MSKKRKSFLKSLDQYDWFFILVAFISIGYGLYRAYDMGPDLWGNVAGPLFSLASGFLFVVALRMQLREHRHALEEMEQNNANHADLLLVAKQEKEFNVCITAIKDLSSDWKALLSGIERNAGPWHNISMQWMSLYHAASFYQHNGLQKRYVNGQTNYDLFLQDYVVISDLVERTKWVVYSIESKTLATMDRGYLAQLARPVVHDLGERMIPCFEIVAAEMTKVLNAKDKQEQYNTNSNVLSAHKTNYIEPLLQKLRDSASRLHGIT